MSRNFKFSWGRYSYSIEKSRIKCSKVKRLLGIHIDYTLKFDNHVDTICKKAHRKLTALSRITKYMELTKRRILMNAIYKAQFTYGPIIWMIHSRCLNNKNQQTPWTMFKDYLQIQTF